VRPEFDPAVSRAGRHTQDLIGDLRACARRAAGRSASLSRHPSKRKHPNLPARSTYTPEIGQKIARLMCDETLTLKEACAKAEAPYSTVMKWKDSHPEFELEISRARAALADGLYQDVRRVEARLRGRFSRTRHRAHSHQLKAMGDYEIRPQGLGRPQVP
jgi:hypothetical protein